MTPSSTHLVLIPSYNPGARVFSTVQAALDQWAPVWVVVDGSTDHSEHRLSEMAASEPNLRVWVLPKNGGKGAAVGAGVGAGAGVSARTAPPKPRRNRRTASISSR